MSIEVIALSGAKWLWEKYGKDLLDKTVTNLGQKWGKVKWADAESNYRSHMFKQHGTVRLLGYPTLIEITKIFSDVFVTNVPAAHRWREIADLKKLPFGHATLKLDTDRFNVVDIVKTEQRVYIKGKPGAGKTTLLKHLVLQSCIGEMIKTPIFISLTEWADSNCDLLTYIVKQFDVCGFPDAKEFLLYLFEKGQALVLFDALDEVKQEKQNNVIREIKEFIQRYPNLQICLTCRVNANDYSFEQFIITEIVDFDKEQRTKFIQKWQFDDESKCAKVLEEFESPYNDNLRDLAGTPLLLALLCLMFDEIGYFPSRRADIYREALDALMRKWDSSRGIKRDESYQLLSFYQKKELLSLLAFENFEIKSYYIQVETLVRQITQYLKQLYEEGKNDQPDGEAVLKAIEAQHGLLTEQAHGIYSFSHLTFQEYFTANHIVQDHTSERLSRLIQEHSIDKQWHEVFLLTSSLLSNADIFFNIFTEHLRQIIILDNDLVELLVWANNKAVQVQDESKIAALRSFFISLATNHESVCKSARSLATLLEIDYEEESDAGMPPEPLGDPDIYLIHKLERVVSSIERILSYLREKIKFSSEWTDNLVVVILESMEIAEKNNLPELEEKLTHIILPDTNASSTEWLTLLETFNNILITTKHSLRLNRHFSEKQTDNLLQYLELNYLLVECLESANVSKRDRIEDRLLTIN